MLYSRGIVCRGQWSTCVHYVSYSQRRVEVGRALWRSSHLVQMTANCSRLLRALSSWGLNCSVHGNSTASCWMYYQVTTKMHSSRFQSAKAHASPEHLSLPLHLLHFLFPGGHLKPGRCLPKRAHLG